MQGPSWLSRLVGIALAITLLGFFGAVLGSLLLFLAFALPVLLVVGLVAQWNFRRVHGPALRAAQQAFRETAFTLMGRIAKSDGRISEQEIAITEQLIARLGLAAEHRQEAIALFKRGADPDFSVDAQLDVFVARCGAHPNLRQMLLLFLFSTAAADGALAAPEHELLRHVAERIGFPPGTVDQLLRMFAAQDAFSQAPGAPPRAHALAEAYAALGVEESADDRSVKQAYRRLMSQYHPDKLIAEGMPEDMVRMATERTQEIQNAWELIRKARGI